jgi:hypothetical protein
LANSYYGIHKSEIAVLITVVLLICWQADCDIRDYGKKVQQLEIGFDETNDKLLKATESLEEKEKHFKEVSKYPPPPHAQ